jgi:hydroxymethylpyrimidine/phosphomethylpyrimidine kinase
MYKALTVAGSDSGGGAGIQTDLKTFAAHGVYGTSVITALTAQNTKGVHGIHPVPADFIACQMEAVLSDIQVQAAKTGMLGGADVIDTVAKMLTQYRVTNLVVDPVMVAESGDRLLPEDAVDAMRNRLLPLALVVTPNLPETEVLLGRKIHSVDAMVAAAREIHRLGPRNVLIKGGHLPGEEMVDVFFDGKEIHRLTEKKLDTIHTHGTGCTYAAAITSQLAKGKTPLEAVTKGKAFITGAIANGICVGSGYGPTNPMGTLLREVELGHASRDLYKALSILQRTSGTGCLLAPGHTNIFHITESKNIASFPAPLTRCEHGIDVAGEPILDSAHVPAEILQSAHKKDATIGALINLRYTPEIASAAANLNLKTTTHTNQLLLFAPTATEAAQQTATLTRTLTQC